MNCCKNRDNFATVAGTQQYNEDGRIIEFQTKCKVCGNVERWFCENLKTNFWVKVNMKIKN